LSLFVIFFFEGSFFYHPFVSDHNLITYFHLKALLYICVFAGALLLPVSERAREVFFQSVQVAVTGVEDVIRMADSAEVRQVDGPVFDQVIREPGRIVVVEFYNENGGLVDAQQRKLDRAVKHLPSKVLVAKVLADRNMELMDRLQIHNIPTLLVYRDGQLLEEFKGGIDCEKFTKIVKYHLKNPSSKPYYGGYVGPIEKGWLPEGVEVDSRQEGLVPLSVELQGK